MQGEATSVSEVNSSKSDAVGGLHILTLTPFYPSATDDANGCFVSEPLEWLAKLGVRNTVMAVQPVYRGNCGSGGSAVRGGVRWGFFPPGRFGFAHGRRACVCADHNPGAEAAWCAAGGPDPRSRSPAVRSRRNAGQQGTRYSVCRLRTRAGCFFHRSGRWLAGRMVPPNLTSRLRRGAPRDLRQ